MSIEPIASELDHEVQGLPLTGYADESCMRTLVLEVKHAGEARCFVHALRKCIDFGGLRTGSKPRRRINIGFSHEGLRALGTPEEILRELKDKSPAFGEGAPLRAARYLGDAGPSAVERWNPVFQRKQAHVWIALHDEDPARLDDALKKLRGLEGADRGLGGWEHGKTIPQAEQMVRMQDTADGKQEAIREVHFGFRDNITKPSIFLHRKIPRPAEGHKPRPGELLLGYANNVEVDLWTADTGRGLADFLRNGSFGILRQLQQDVAGFEAYLRQQAGILAGRGYAYVTTEYLKAKLCGRWPNGAPVLPGELEQPDRPGEDRLLIDFTKDPEGRGCPFGAHVRRANPRTDPLLPPRERVLFRRGVPYGKRYTGERDGIERGLMGVFFCSRIDDQFELLVAEWLEKNPLGPPNRGRAKDPLSGRHDEPDAQFHIPLQDGTAITLDAFSPFVRTRGTMYAFFPSRRALAMIATGDFRSAR